MKNDINLVDEKSMRWRDPRSLLRTIQLVLPLVLFLFVLATEAQEHLSRGGEGVTIHFVIEVLFFGVLGPGILYLIFGFILTLMKEQIEARDKLKELNQELEAKVASRTLALEPRNVELIKANK